MTEISICMVSLNCWNVLKDCLESVRLSRPFVSREVIVVDNASSDGTPEYLQQYFPEIRLIQNQRNVGFTKATNQAIKLSVGRYILWLNTDTILQPDALYKSVQFLDNAPQAGIVGPKVLNADGTFQPQCRRGMPTPLASLSYMLRLDKLWPNKSWATQYLLTHLPIDQANQVISVSGCYLMAKRQVYNDIGILDEAIFGFGEDIDWCVRAKQAGWEVWYYPESIITHLKGQGGVQARPYHKIWGIHQAMWVFYRKHLMPSYSWLVTGMVWLGIGIRVLFSIIGVWLRQAARVLLHRLS